MDAAVLPVLTSQGDPIPTDPASFGFLRDSNDLLSNPAALRQRMEEDGYLFLPGFLDREEVRAVRMHFAKVLSDEGLLDPDAPAESLTARSGIEMYFRPDLVNQEGIVRDQVRKIIYGERMMSFFDAYFGTKARHYDFTWLRVIAPGGGTCPHCDVVYMGRGSTELVTAWVPFGDVPLEVGGLILKERSHRDQRLREGYGSMDVDTACQNRPGESQTQAAGYEGFGAYRRSLVDVDDVEGGRWLTCPEYRMGDLLLFSVYTLHGSLDNHSRQIRISSDSRYQPANQPIDERWVGENPPGHGGNSVLQMIC